MDHTERGADTPAAVVRQALGGDLEYKPEWVGQIRDTYNQTIINNVHVKDMTKLRGYFAEDLDALTRTQGLFINILMWGRKRLLETYRTTFSETMPIGVSGKTDPPGTAEPRVTLDANLKRESLPRTMIHEYTHLATIAKYAQTDPWPADDEDEQKRVVKLLTQTWPTDDGKGGFLRWNAWLDSLDNEKHRGLWIQIYDVLVSWRNGYDMIDWNREALPHVVEIIYYLYRAGIGWWTVTTGPISVVADLLTIFTFTGPVN